MIRYLIRGIRILYIYKILPKWHKIINILTCYRENLVLGKNWLIFGVLKISNKGIIKIGDNFRANSGQEYNPIGGDDTIRLVCGVNASLVIGNNVSLSNSTIVCHNEITIEDNVGIGGNCKIWDTDFHSLDAKIRFTEFDRNENVSTKKILIKRNAFIGSSVIILKGVTIGGNSIVGAGSVVTKSIPDNQIWAGNPAKYIKNITPTAFGFQE